MMNPVMRGGIKYNAQVSSVRRDGVEVYALSNRERPVRESRWSRLARAAFAVKKALGLAGKDEQPPAKVMVDPTNVGYTVKAAERLATTGPSARWSVVRAGVEYIRCGRRLWLPVIGRTESGRPQLLDRRGLVPGSVSVQAG